MESIIQRASTFAADIDFLIMLVAWIVGFWGLLAEGVLFYFIFKYRKKEGVASQYVGGEKKEEKKWISIPHMLILLFDIAIIIFAVQVWYKVKQDLPPAEETIRVVGHQWSWRFVHPGLDGQLGTADDVEKVDELHIKVNTLYHFKLESADVLHSFSVPVFRLKQDAIPGRVITGWFEATKTGMFDIQCAEMCGIGHGIMGSQLYIETADEHSSWLSTQSSG
jgi:cytochrome c oxidase subunit II